MIKGDGGQEAAEEVGARRDVEIRCFVIGPGREVIDIYDDWARLSEVAESGCVLVRPDVHVARRRHSVAAASSGELARVISRVLGFEQPPKEEAAGIEETVET